LIKEREKKRLDLKFGVLISFLAKKFLSNKKKFFFWITKLYRQFSIEFGELTDLSNENEFCQT
jgi:hypothetical protein